MDTSARKSVHTHSHRRKDGHTEKRPEAFAHKGDPERVAVCLDDNAKDEYQYKLEREYRDHQQDQRPGEEAVKVGGLRHDISLERHEGDCKDEFSDNSHLEKEYISFIDCPERVDNNHQEE